MYHHRHNHRIRNVNVFRTILGIGKIKDIQIRGGFEWWFQSWIDPHLEYMDIHVDVKDVNITHMKKIEGLVRHVFPHLPESCWCREMSNCVQHYCHLDFPENYRHRHPDQSIVNVPVKRYRYQYQGHTYHIKITHLIGTDDHDHIITHLYLLSPKVCLSIKGFHCILVMTHGDSPHVADSADVNTFHAFGRPQIPSYTSGIEIKIMLQYLTDHIDQLGIRTIEINDNNHYIWHENHAKSLHLEKSRQLEGMFPYYMQFGFMPKFLSAYQKIVSNRQRLSKMTARDHYHTTTIFCHVPLFTLKEVQYVETHLDQPISRIFRYLSRANRTSYSHMYQAMFEIIELSQLNGDELIYVYHIDT